MQAGLKGLKATLAEAKAHLGPDDAIRVLGLINNAESLAWEFISVLNLPTSVGMMGCMTLDLIIEWMVHKDQRMPESTSCMHMHSGIPHRGLVAARGISPAHRIHPGEDLQRTGPGSPVHWWGLIGWLIFQANHPTP